MLLAVLEARRTAPTFRWSWEAAAQAAAVACALWVVFGIEPAHAERFFYMLFLPLIWISVRHGIRGATWTLLAMQLGIVGAVQVQGLASATLLELQVFMVALAITGLFLGAVVTERRHAGEALEAREAELQRSLRLAAAAETASALAHELNQPLSAIATYVRACAILAERPEENRTRLVETMGTVTTEVARAGDVVRRLREFFRSGASRLEHASVARLLANAAERAAPRLERHRIALTVECDPALPGVLVDRLQIETVVHNLIANAIDAIAAGDPPARAIVLRAVRDARDAVRITVRTPDRDCRGACRRARSRRSPPPSPTAWGSGWRSAARSSRVTAAGSPRIRPSAARRSRLRCRRRRPPSSSHEPPDGVHRRRRRRRPRLARDAARAEGLPHADVRRRGGVPRRVPARLARLRGARPAHAWHERARAAGRARSARRAPAGDHHHRSRRRGHHARGAQGRAVDFVEKPIDDQVLVAAIAAALDRDARERERAQAATGAAERLARLTAREREVLALVAEGRHNREIAVALGISPRTVEVYKARMMEKLQARRMPDLVRLVLENPQH